MSTNTGGPAFPTPAHNLKNDGMTLRDYFAAKAMQGLLASHWCEVAREMTPSTGERTLADDAYAIANAMLKAREA
jgi:hypothetical protein